ncbi:MAG: 3-deoxy-D-manno-octulosonate 8-phosphate phosphatase (KDO 8-P phosphatase) [Cyclobacteriaceae bacterium]|jgi:3-deoxy-D-manno-octulosonate 8-phosphate phosphatase (KDO 8-P phosphatase)
MTKKIKFLVLDVDGTMTDGGIYVLEDGSQFKKFNAKDGMGIKLAIKSGIEVGIISHSHTTEMVNSRANMLGMKYIYVGQESKLKILENWLEEMEISLSEVAFIGDDVNDLSIMQVVGHTACPSDSVKEIKAIAKVILKSKGGEGAVREFIDEHLLV